MRAASSESWCGDLLDDQFSVAYLTDGNSGGQVVS